MLNRINQSAQTSAGIGVGLQHTEDVSLCIGKIGEVANTGYGLARRSLLGSGSDGLFGHLVQIVNADGVRRALNAVAGRDGSIDTHLFVIAGSCQPVVHAAAPFVDLPAEDILIKLDRPLRLFSRNFEMNDASHNLPPNCAKRRRQGFADSRYCWLRDNSPVPLL